MSTEKLVMPSESWEGRAAELWYCPVCGYIDPMTRNVRCPRRHPEGVGHPLFRQAYYGYFIRVGIEEASV